MTDQSIRQFLFEVLQQEASKITDPKRSGLSIDQLGMKMSGGVHNIISVYNQATIEEKDYWGRWYHNAKLDVEELAKQFSLPFEVVAGIVAVLSPGNRWNSNLIAAEKLLKGQDKINAYPRQALKAKEILQTGNVGLVSGPKVTVFFNSLVNPKLVEKNMVLDGHAINIWRGSKDTLKSMKYPNASQRAQMINDYQTAAKELGVSTQAVQAVTWYIWKHTGKTPSLKSPADVYDVSGFRSMEPANDVDQEKTLDEVNALASGLVVGTGMGDGTEDSKKLMWSGNESLKETFFPDAPQDPGFFYHATNTENTLSILGDGAMVPHPPDYGTEQDEWPDGSTALRSYFGGSPRHVEPFYPHHGKALLVRVPENAARFKKERGTGDFFTNQTIPASALEFWNSRTKEWHPIQDLESVLIESVVNRVLRKIVRNQ